jgi:DNA-binding IclR family transcriptional regulator
VLFECAATLGVIDVAYTDPAGARDDYRSLWGGDRRSRLSRYDGLLAVRVNELGAAVLHDPDLLAALSLPMPRLRAV